MAASPQTYGIATALLAPFLPYGIQVEHYTTAYGGMVIRDVLQALDATTGRLQLSQSVGLTSRDVLPVLRTFKQLDQPLDTGENVLREIALLAFGWRWPTADSHILPEKEFVFERVENMEVGAVAVFDENLYFHIGPTWDMQLVRNGQAEACLNQAAIKRFLVERHFAYGMPADSFIPF
jgi:hypothetical protein